LKTDIYIDLNHSLTAQTRNGLIFALLFVFVSVVFLLDIFLGSVSITPGEVVRALFTDDSNSFATIILKFRVPKAITALMVGIGLSLSGLQMQTIFRNPMAGPDVLGISSGASLGVAIVILGISASVPAEGLKGMGNWMMVAASWAGAGVVMVLIMIISSRVKEIMTILILGIMLSGGISAIVTIMQYLGSLGNLTNEQLNVLFISITAGVLISLFSAKMLNALLLGEGYAQSVGLNVRFARIVIFTCTSILAGTVTAFCGPIGFIGIAVPHIARIIFRTSNHRILVPGTMLTGGGVMLASDIISQLPGSDSVLPLNAVTSLIGIPVVVWVIFRNRRYSGLF
jgi:iron complex transport system permease protein